MKALQGMFVRLRKAPALQASALKARSRAAQGERAARSEALEPWVVDAIDSSPERGGTGCAALSGLMDLLAGNPGLRMLRILQPGLLCPAPSALTALAIGWVTLPSTFDAYSAGFPILPATSSSTMLISLLIAGRIKACRKEG